MGFEEALRLNSKEITKKCSEHRKPLNNRPSLKPVPWRPIWEVNAEVSACWVTSAALSATLVTVAAGFLFPWVHRQEQWTALLQEKHVQPWVGKTPGGRHGSLLQDSGPENPMWSTSSPWVGKTPGGRHGNLLQDSGPENPRCLPRVGHDWNNLASTMLRYVCSKDLMI